MNQKCKSCSSCAMPMEEKSHFALADTSQELCCFCTDAQGKLLPWEQILASNAKYYVESQGISQDAAVRMASELLKKQPAWSRARA
jgi:hypothetical protein